MTIESNRGSGGEDSIEVTAVEVGKWEGHYMHYEGNGISFSKTNDLKDR